MRSAPRLLVVWKKSVLELFREHDPAALDHLARREPQHYERLIRADAENRHTLALVREALDALGLSADFAYRGNHPDTDGYDLVVTVGGDGTLLDVSHSVRRTPLLGVNSSSLSVGHFCATNGAGFRALMERWLEGSVPVVALQRLQVRVDDRDLPVPVLNDVLFASTEPAASSRYRIEVEGQGEEQTSSGVWIATAAGSTAAIRSAGGTVVDPRDDRIQYLVREPYVPLHAPPPRLVRGFTRAPIRIVNRMRQAAVYLDGHREAHRVGLAEVVTIDRYAEPLRLVGLRIEDRGAG